MFSIHLAEPEGRQARRRRLRERLLGKFLGFAAGLTLILAVDALFLHGRLVQSVSEGFVLNEPALSHAVKSAWASIAGR